MTHRFDDDVEYEPEAAPRRSRWISIIVIVGLAATGSALAFLWRAYRDNVPIFPSFGSAMEYPHWMMVAGAILVVVGFVGFAFRKNKAMSDEKGPEQTSPTDEPRPTRDAVLKAKAK